MKANSKRLHFWVEWRSAKSMTFNAAEFDSAKAADAYFYDLFDREDVVKLTLSVVCGWNGDQITILSK